MSDSTPSSVNVEPTAGAEPGVRPPRNDTEIADIVAFLKTLTDADQPDADQPGADQR